MPRLLTDEEISRQLAELPDWSRAARAITAGFKLPSFRAALALVQEVGDIAEEMDHHPDIDVRYDQVTLSVFTHSAGGLTQLDIELAHRISAAARVLQSG
jgi:4a-hydroxytetrahydrobiopterin dehydratase